MHTNTNKTPNLPLTLRTLVTAPYVYWPTICVVIPIIISVCNKCIARTACQEDQHHEPVK